MKAWVNQRLTELKQELASGERQLAVLETRQSELRQTLLRIAGAIQVLEELEAAAGAEASAANGVVQGAPEA